jgi:hypothetical protein
MYLLIFRASATIAIFEKFCEFSNIFYSIILCKMAFGWDEIGLGLPQVQQCCTPPFFSNSAAFSKTMRRRSAAWEISN